MSRLFVSYAHEDVDWADEFVVTLKNAGQEIWRDVDCMKGGEVIASRVSDAIRDSGSFCVLLSPEAVKSFWVELELSAAISRRHADPSFTLFPIELQQGCMPELLRGLLYMEGWAVSPQQAADHIVEALRAPGSTNNRELIKSVDWDAVLSLIEADQFSDSDGCKCGGWSRSYAAKWHKLSFPLGTPDGISQTDSISVTCFVIRGLRSLRRMFVNSGGHGAPFNRIARLLSRARPYLDRHFDGTGAGLIHDSATGPVLHRDVHHSAMFVQALLQLPGVPLSDVRAAAGFALSDLALDNRRAPTEAERLRLLGLQRSRPDIRASWATPVRLREIQMTLEDRIVDYAHGVQSVEADCKLFGHDTQPHMSGFYSWWVLDACGELLLESDRDHVRATATQVGAGIEALKIRMPPGELAFPLVLDGGPDIGATACFGEVLLRLWPSAYARLAEPLSDFVMANASRDRLARYDHTWLLWALPTFFERLHAATMEAAVGATP